MSVWAWKHFGSKYHWASNHWDGPQLLKEADSVSACKYIHSDADDFSFFFFSSEKAMTQAVVLGHRLWSHTLVCALECSRADTESDWLGLCHPTWHHYLKWDFLHATSTGNALAINVKHNAVSIKHIGSALKRTIILNLLHFYCSSPLFVAVFLLLFPAWINPVI